MNFASSVPDFRRTGKGNIRHRMADIIMLMILGRTSGRVGRAEIIEFGRLTRNLRAATHKDNLTMQNLLEGCGFRRCGIIHLQNGDERIAYHKLCQCDSGGNGMQA